MSTLSQIEKRLADQYLNLKRSDINKCIEIILSGIIDALCSNEFNVELRNFGKFSTKIQKARVGRNPATGTKVNVPQKRVLKWKCSKKASPH